MVCSFSSFAGCYVGDELVGSRLGGAVGFIGVCNSYLLFRRVLLTP